MRLFYQEFQVGILELGLEAAWQVEALVISHISSVIFSTVILIHLLGFLRQWICVRQTRLITQQALVRVWPRSPATTPRAGALLGDPMSIGALF